MRKFLSFLYKILVPLVILWLVFLNYRLYYMPQYAKVDGATINQDVLFHLQHLKEKMHGGAALEMQELYPEGFVFTNVLYGLAWCQLGQRAKSGTPLHQDALTEATWAYRQILSPEGRQPFSKDMRPTYGAFYQGWSNYLLGKIIQCQGIENTSTRELSEFKEKSKTIAKGLSDNGWNYMPSYIGMEWPADNVVALASLGLHDQLLPSSFKSDLAKWLKNVQLKLDKETGLIPHATSPQVEGARGSSQSLMLRFLLDIDEGFALEQFEKYRKQFVTYRFGLPGVREYPLLYSGGGDIDSGPVILEVGGAASLVGIGTMKAFGQHDLAKGLRNAVEAFGLSWKSQEKKSYLFGSLPVADAFIAWSNSTPLHLHAGGENYDFQMGRIGFHLCSLMLILFLVYFSRIYQKTKRFFQQFWWTLKFTIAWLGLQGKNLVAWLKRLKSKMWPFRKKKRG